MCKRGYANINVAQQLDNIRVQKKERIYLTEDEMQRFLNVIDKPIIYAACATICFTGIRISELCGLKLADVKFGRNEITVVCGKGKKDRTIPMNPELKEILKEYKEEYRCEKSEYFFATKRSKKKVPSI